MATSKTTGSKTAASKTTTATKTAQSSKAKSGSTAAKVKPGTKATENMKLYVKDSRGKTLGEISVPASHSVPPTAIKKAESYSKKKS